MELLKPGEICSETYLGAGAFDSKEEATNYMDYLKTQFVRFLILQIAMTAAVKQSVISAFVPFVGILQENGQTNNCLKI